MAETEWHPIETAPKDGTYILLFGVRATLLPHHREVAISRWFDYHPDDYRSQSGHWGGGVTNPTMWMPIPA